MFAVLEYELLEFLAQKQSALRLFPDHVWSAKRFKDGSTYIVKASDPVTGDMLLQELVDWWPDMPTSTVQLSLTVDQWIMLARVFGGDERYYESTLEDEETHPNDRCRCEVDIVRTRELNRVLMRTMRKAFPALNDAEKDDIVNFSNEKEPWEHDYQ